MTTTPAPTLQSEVDRLAAARQSRLLDESLISMAQAAKRFPPYRGGSPTNPSTVWRWVTTGVKLPDGSRLRLEAVRCASRWLTSLEAIGRFVAAQTAAVGGELPALAPVGLGRRDSRQDAVEAELAGLGV
jgi:hypothetical protein